MRDRKQVVDGTTAGRRCRHWSGPRFGEPLNGFNNGFRKNHN